MSADVKRKIQEANEEFLRRMTSGDPVLVDVAPAGDAIPDLPDRTILHSGPPVTWQKMSGAQRGACAGMVVFEGWADGSEDAARMLERGEIRLEPNHHHRAVGPMAGTITPSMWVWVVENKGFGNRAYCRQVEGRQQSGEYTAEALEGLRGCSSLGSVARAWALAVAEVQEGVQ